MNGDDRDLTTGPATNDVATWSFEPGEPQPVVRERPRRVLMPILLFVATCLSTWYIGGLAFAFAIMCTLLAHELGHFLQAVRYRVPASLPYFIPMPFSPIGTMGAFIVMQPGVGDRRSLFDIAVTGPLAGFFPAVFFSTIGLYWSEVVHVNNIHAHAMLGEPLFFKALVYLVFGNLPENHDIVLHPVAFAGWVGIFVTALNLVPIGQLDGGHILYSLLLERAHPIAQLLLLGAAAAVLLFGYWGWTLMLFLLMLMGPVHPPTANDHIPLGTGRTVLGWIALLFMPIGFTPTPFVIS